MDADFFEEQLVPLLRLRAIFILSHQLNIKLAVYFIERYPQQSKFLHVPFRLVIFNQALDIKSEVGIFEVILKVFVELVQFLLIFRLELALADFLRLNIAYEIRVSVLFRSINTTMVR